MHRQNSRAWPLILSVLLLTPLVAGSQEQTAERSRTQGLKETDRFVKAGGGMTDAASSAKLQMQKTLEAYNVLVTRPSTNMKGDYKKLLKAMDAMNDRATEATTKIDQMQTAGDTYFAGRAETIKGIQNQELHDRAQQRLSENQKQFAGILQSLREAGQALDPFRRDLADHIKYLGSDLTPSAMASLKPDADKLNAQGTELFSRTDKAIADANAYFQSLKSSQS
jgi:hypothetical protein